MSHSRRSNIKGSFERAVTWWHLGANLACRKMGRGAMSAFQAALGLREHANRKLFLQDGTLVAFPRVDTLALWLGVNEKTMRRGINRLEEAGMVRPQHRFNSSNLYYLTMPPEVESQLFEAEAQLNRRRRARRNDAPKCPPHRTDGNGAAPKCPSTSESTSDSPLSLRGTTPSCHTEFKDREEREEKRLSEEVSAGNEAREPLDSEESSSPSLSQAFRGARRLDSYAASVVGKAIHHWDRTPGEILEAIDTVRDMDGGATELAHELYEHD